MNGYFKNSSAGTPTQLRVAAYCRVSTGFGEQMNSFDNQVSIYMDKIAKNPNWVLADIYADPAISGTTDNRPEFQRMIQDAEKGQFNLLLVKSISRFARNTLVSMQTVQHLQSLGIGVIFEKENIDTTKSYSEMMLTILSAFAQEESRNISERVRKGKRMKEARGEIPWNPLYGYTRVDDTPFVIVDNEAEVVRRIFSEYISGAGLAEIMEALNREGIPSPGGTLWIKNSVTNVLRNERYCGDVMTMKVYCHDHMTHKYKRNQGEVDQYLVEDHHTPIVSREIFKCAQEIRKLRKDNVYPYQGFLVCPNCGRKLVRMMRGWGCSCNRFYIPATKLNAALLKAYEAFDPSDTADEKSRMIKVQNPTVNSVEYWWLKELVDRITFDGDCKNLTVHWICEKKTEVPTGYARMWGDIKSHTGREAAERENVWSRQEKTVMKVPQKKNADSTQTGVTHSNTTKLMTRMVDKKPAAFGQGET